MVRRNPVGPSLLTRRIPTKRLRTPRVTRMRRWRVARQARHLTRIRIRQRVRCSRAGYEISGLADENELWVKSGLRRITTRVGARWLAGARCFPTACAAGACPRAIPGNRDSERLHAHIDRAISRDFSAEKSFSTSRRANSNAVPAPRDVSSGSSSTIRSFSRMCGSSLATEKCAV